MATAWTLEGELMQLAGAADTASALTTLGMIDAGENFALDTVQDWHRSGAETYSLHFTVATRSRRGDFVLKACVAHVGGQSLKDTFAEWLSRRSLLDELGAGTPRLYVAGKAVLVEEYIPYTLADALVNNQEHREVILRALARTAGLLVSAGFVPFSAQDWRSRGTDVVLIDFGQDLGPPNTGHGSEAGLLSEILDNVERAGVTLSPAELALVGSSYESSLPD